jgi:hypothetical protein
MATETGASVCSQILEERVVCRNRGNAWLECPDAPARIVVDLKLGNDGRRRLGGILRQRKGHGAGQKPKRHKYRNGESECLEE